MTVLLLLLAGLFLIGLLLEPFTRGRRQRQLEERGIERELRWREVTEPEYREYPGYPPDWQTRRTEVYFNAGGRCERCGGHAGSVPTSEAARWLHPRPKLIGGHVHHKVPISRGGTHAVTNLELLCGGCHALAHPSNALLDQRFRAEQVRYVRFDARPKIRRARKDWRCAGCRAQIQIGEEYFGTSKDRLCQLCAPHHRWFGT